MNFYKSKEWLKAKECRLRIDSYQCQLCKRKGKSKGATHVHHIKPLKWCVDNDRSMLYSTKNLISLCVSCHNSMHNRSNDKLTRQGLDLVKRIFGVAPPLS